MPDVASKMRSVDAKRIYSLGILAAVSEIDTIEDVKPGVARWIHSL